MYKARARRNGYRMFISVYILCYSFTCSHTANRFGGSIVIHLIPQHYVTVWHGIWPVLTSTDSMIREYCIIFLKHCRSRSDGLWWSHLIRIHTVSTLECCMFTGCSWGGVEFLPSGGDFWLLSITFANSLDPKRWAWSGSKLFVTQMVSRKKLSKTWYWKKHQQTRRPKSNKNYPVGKS